MRKIRNAFVNHIDVQMATDLLSRNLAKIGVKEKDIISIQQMKIEKPFDIGEAEKAKVTLHVYYWSKS